MKLHIRLFAGLAELLGSPSIQAEFDQETLTAGELKKLLSKQYPAAAGQIGQAFVAVNQEYAPDDAPVSAQDEIALIPPVSGGEPLTEHAESTADGLFTITPHPLNIEETAAKVLHPNHGASLLFVGTTREMTGERQTVYLDYEAYTPMALKKLQEIGAEIGAKWPGTLTAVSHRIGKVDIAEASVVIAVSAPHRDICYEASRFAIEQLKQNVPIWKKEIWDDGSEWKDPQTGKWSPVN